MSMTSTTPGPLYATALFPDTPISLDQRTARCGWRRVLLTLGSAPEGDHGRGLGKIPQIAADPRPSCGHSVVVTRPVPAERPGSCPGVVRAPAARGGRCSWTPAGRRGPPPCRPRHDDGPPIVSRVTVDDDGDR